MNREHILNDYTEELTNKGILKSETENYVYKLEERLNSAKTLYDIVMELDNFLERVDLPDKVYKDLTRIRDGFNGNTNAIMARKQLLMYLGRYEVEQQHSYEKSKDTVNDIKDEFIQKQEKKLNDAGIDVTGDKDELKVNVNDEANVEKIEENVDAAVERYEEINEYADDKRNVEVDYHDLGDSVNNAGDETVLNAAMEDSIFLYKSNNPMNVTLKEDGSVMMEGDSNNPSAFNYAAMLTLMLSTNDPDLSLGTNFDVAFNKNAEDSTRFVMKFGDFPLAKHPDRKATEVLMAKISKQAELYDKGNNYIDELAQTSPELREAFRLINGNVLNKTGAFKMLVRNNGNTHALAMKFDENYKDIGQALSTNGASMITDESFEGVDLSSVDRYEQAMILANTNETLRVEKAEALTKENGYQKALKLEEVANVDTKFLQVLLVANILMLIVLIALIVLTIVK